MSSDDDGSDGDGEDGEANFLSSAEKMASSSTRRFFSPPHPSFGVGEGALTSPSTKAHNSDKLSSGVKDAIESSSTVVAENNKKQKKVRFQHNNKSPPPLPPQKSILNRFYRATGFMSHANCGLHKLTVVAKDIHKQINTLIFHKRSFDRCHEKGIVRSKDYLLPHHPGGASQKNNNNKQKRKIMDGSSDDIVVVDKTTSPVVSQNKKKSN